MKNISSDCFEHQYVKMMEEVEKNIEHELVLDFCHTQLEWNEDKIAKFIDNPDRDGQFLTIDELIFHADKQAGQKEREKIKKLAVLLQLVTNQN